MGLSNVVTAKDSMIQKLEAYISARHQQPRYIGWFGFFGYSKEDKIDAARALINYFLEEEGATAQSLVKHLPALMQSNSNLGKIWDEFARTSELSDKYGQIMSVYRPIDLSDDNGESENYQRAFYAATRGPGGRDD